MELKKLKEYIKFMEENNLDELEIEEEGKKIKLRKGTLNQSPLVISQPSSVTPKEEAPAVQDNSQIKSPMVGTFYRAPSPGAKPYVEVGDNIKKGDVVCIIEAMKLMNEIKAELGGKISQISVENGDAVEFGQALFTIEPA